MKIGIDARFLRKQRAGMGNYVKGLAEQLPRLAPQHDYILYSNRDIDWDRSSEPFCEHVDRGFGWCPSAFWLLGRGASWMKRDAIDVYWASAPILPLGMPPGVLKVITVHDLVWLRCPETSDRYNLLVENVCSRRAISQADYILVVSRSTQEELISSLRVPREKTRLVYPGVLSQYKPQDPAQAAEYISHKYGVPRRYLATVGTVHPRKNNEFLVKVLRILRSNRDFDCPLLVAGSLAKISSPLFRQIEAAGLTEKDIRFLGYVPDEDMPSFYAGAQIFVYPSLYEGFGIPPVEAMACGTPVISSDAPAMPEVLGDAAILISLTSPEGFAAEIVRVLNSDRLRADLREKGIRRARTFRYETSATRLMQVFEGTRLESTVDLDRPVSVHS